jgi:MATE family multidrug resistance protein
MMLGLFGAVALAVNQIVQAVGSVLYMLPLGMSAAAAIRVGQAIGGGERERLRPVATAAMGLVSGWMELVTAGLVLFGGAVAADLSNDPAVVALARRCSSSWP